MRVEIDGGGWGGYCGDGGARGYMVMLCNRDRSFGFEEALTFTPRYQLGRDDTSNARFLDEEERWWVVI